MADERLLGPPRVRRRLAELSQREENFDPAALAHADPAGGWSVTDIRQTLPSEPPGLPEPGGSWESARRLMRGYEFADPSIVRAYYDPDRPLAERDMLLKLQSLGGLHLYVGVRVGEVYERTEGIGARQARIWGWNYRTLEGHVEMGQMDWQVWKRLEDGEVEFRVHAVSRPAPIANPFVRVGFRILRGHERAVFLQSTRRRMRGLVEVALEHDGRADPVRSTANRLTVRRSRSSDAAHDALANNLRTPEPGA